MPEWKQVKSLFLVHIHHLSIQLGYFEAGHVLRDQVILKLAMYLNKNFACRLDCYHRSANLFMMALLSFFFFLIFPCRWPTILHESTTTVPKGTLSRCPVTICQSTGAKGDALFGHIVGTHSAERQGA